MSTTLTSASAAAPPGGDNPYPVQFQKRRQDELQQQKQYHQFTVYQ